MSFIYSNVEYAKYNPKIQNTVAHKVTQSQERHQGLK